jgi:hypothetical protein
VSAPQPSDALVFFGATGSWGPAEADRLLAAIPGGWREPVDPVPALAARAAPTEPRKSR